MRLHNQTATIAHGIDLHVAATHALFTTSDSGERFYPLYVVIEATAATGVSLPAAVSIGTNSPLFDNILPITTLTGLLGLNTKLLVMLTVTGLATIPSNTAVTLKVTTA